MRIAQPITITDQQKKTLERWARGRSTPARLVLRAQIVLLAAGGLGNKDIALKLHANRLLVGKWRKRFADKGLAGIEKDAPRGGRPPVNRDALTSMEQCWLT